MCKSTTSGRRARKALCAALSFGEKISDACGRLSILQMWTFLYVTANHEKQVSKFLSAHNVIHYLPLYEERSRWSDREVSIERPVFPGYLFVRFRPEQRRFVLGAPGVVCLTGESDKSGTISDADIERLRKAIALGYRSDLPLPVELALRSVPLFA
jgi:transcription antitermination factor NusG